MRVVTDSEDLSSYLYRYRLIHDASLISLLTICTTGPFLPLASSHAARVNDYRTYPLSRYLAVHYLNASKSLQPPTFLFCWIFPRLHTHPGRLIQSHTFWHILHALTHTLLRTVI